VTTPRIHIREGDKVIVLSGKDRDKTGKVLEVNPASGKVLVEGVNMVKKHQRPTRADRKGGILEMEGAVSSSKVMLVCPRCNKPSRTGHKNLKSGEKVRYCKSCGEVNEK